MEKTRVTKGEYYWWIDSYEFQPHFAQETTQDDYLGQSDERYEVGNYFNSFFEAESMANKLRAVLKGAEVIEMPSEEEIQKVLAEKIPIRSGRSYADALHCCWFEEGIHWLRDNKIVK